MFLPEHTIDRLDVRQARDRVQPEQPFHVGQRTLVLADYLVAG